MKTMSGFPLRCPGCKQLVSPVLVTAAGEPEQWWRCPECGHTVRNEERPEHVSDQDDSGIL
jgi:rRNA maturation endonuclease Nob1